MSSWRISTILACGLLVLPALLCVWFIDRFGVDVPWRDAWDFVGVMSRLESNPSSWVAVLLHQQNEHHVPVAYSFLMGLARLTGYDVRAEMFVGLAFALLTCVVLAKMGKERLSATSESLFLVCPVVWLALTMRQYENWLCGYDMQIFMSVFLFVLTIYLLDHVRQTCSKLFIAMASAFLSVYSFGAGLLVLPLGAIQLGCAAVDFSPGAKRIDRQKVIPFALWSAFSLIVGGLYVSTSKTAWNEHKLTSDYLKQHTGDVVEFFHAFLGSPFCASTDHTSAISIGLILLLMLLVVTVLVASKPKSFQRSMVAPAMLVLYGLGADVLVTLGRVQLGLEAATLSRYVSFNFMFAAGLYLLFLSARNLIPFVRLSFLGAVTTLIAMGWVVGFQDGLLWGKVIYEHNLKLAGLLRSYKVQDLGSMNHLMTFPNEEIKLAPYLEAHHMSVFRDQWPQSQWNPKRPPIVRIDSIAEQRPNGDGLPLIVVDPAKQKYVSVSGWAVDTDSRGPVAAVVICVDGRLDIAAAYGFEKTEIAKALRKNSYRRCGFTASCPSSALGKGIHSLSVKLLSPSKKAYFQGPELVRLEVK